jgi:hypothetical protein
MVEKIVTITIYVDTDRDIYIARSHTLQMEYESASPSAAVVGLVRTLREKLDSEASSE